MSNPYESPKLVDREPRQSPLWYDWFYRASWPIWWLGTALIVASWFDAVTPTVGWIGFGLAAFASVGSYLLPAVAGIKPTEYVALHARDLFTRGEAYQHALERFQNGATLAYDGVAFALQPNQLLACGIVTHAAPLTDQNALELADQAQSIFDKLLSESPEFAAATRCRSFRLSILSGYDDQSRELCRITDGKLDWRR